jgi:hypothetical protein
MAEEQGRPARRRKPTKSVDQLKAEIDARDKAKAERAAAKKKPLTPAEKYEQEKAARASRGSSGYGYSQHLMRGSGSSSGFNPRSVREEFVDPEHGEAPSGRSPLDNVSDHPKASVRRRAVKGFRQQMEKNYGGKWRSRSNDPVREELLVDYLLDEGFASDEKSASAIASAMSEEWKQSIVEESRGEELRAKHGSNPSKKLDAKAFKKALSYDNRDRLPTGTGTELRARYLGLSGRARSRAGGETPASSAVSPDNQSRTVRSRGGKPKGIGAGENRDRPTG